MTQEKQDVYILREEKHTYVGHMKRLLYLRLFQNRYLFSSGQDWILKMWDTSDGKFIKNFEGHTKNINAIEFSKDEEFVLTASSDNNAKMWNIKSGKQVSNSPTINLRSFEWC